MTNTAETLYDCCLSDEIPPLPVLNDYFGSARGMAEICLVLGVYQGLVKQKGLTKELQENCFRTDRLNELVHMKYMHRKSGYYKQFRDLGIDLHTNTMLTCDTEPMPIFDDDFCANCQTEGYLTEDNRAGHIDCETCLQLMCRFCYGKDGDCIKCCRK